MTPAPPTTRRGRSAHQGLPQISGRNAQRKIESPAVPLAPSFTGGLIAYTHLRSEWQGLLVFACMLAAITLLRRPKYPLHLIPLASAILYLAAPPLGAAAAVLISISDDSRSTLPVAHMVVPLLGAWVVTGFGAWITH